MRNPLRNRHLSNLHDFHGEALHQGYILQDKACARMRKIAQDVVRRRFSGWERRKSGER